MCQDLCVPLIEYFAAADDVDAGRVVDGPGGPTAVGFDVVVAKGVDPAVVLGHLESIITARSYDEVVAAPQHCHLITDGDADAFVVTVTDTLRDSLGAASTERLRQAAEPWAATQELAGTEPAMLAEVLEQLASLARRALEQGQHLYCWWAL